jgi:hypothetical protein
MYGRFKFEKDYVLLARAFSNTVLQDSYFFSSFIAFRYSQLEVEKRVHRPWI